MVFLPWCGALSLLVYLFINPGSFLIPLFLVTDLGNHNLSSVSPTPQSVISPGYRHVRDISTILTEQIILK